MKNKARILSGALLLLSFRFFAQPPAPGDVPAPGFSIDKGITALFITGFILGIYLIRKRIKAHYKDHNICDFKKNIENHLKNNSSEKTIVNHHSK